MKNCRYRSCEGRKEKKFNFKKISNNESFLLPIVLDCITSLNNHAFVDNSSLGKPRRYTCLFKLSAVHTPFSYRDITEIG